MPVLLRHIRAYLHDERATATMEFVIMFPVVITLFIAVFETGMILSRQVLLERSLDEAVRILRLANGLTLTADDIEDAICENTRSIPNCAEALVVDLRLINRSTYVIPTPDVVCVNRNDITIEPSNQFEQGQDNDLVMIRTCAIIDRILPFSGFGLNLVRDDTGGLHIVAASVFVNEPN
ncbi:TadE/TadG family type IV pilus assembly protein [Roseicyclus mahoneyensis]|jgi:Flp pilus assembly protein TadG|uniref:Flp pilus assembly protein TadG n=1 Tax=Roseicyclus mahoneyensis TaxID=164332 RepID=A0A316GLW9_9RHOB|nr:TadE/TadG family type IV pilus assembly protein [Roseicyclus mahoneyensis]PWK60909.1 Flp pilus assembly protein TadG [Roseicyclus mahoneyensis]